MKPSCRLPVFNLPSAFCSDIFKRVFIFLLAAAVFLTVSGISGASGTAESPAASRTIFLKSRTFQPEEGRLEETVLQDHGKRHILLQLSSIPGRTKKDNLRKQGIHLLSYIPEHAWIASISTTQSAASLKASGVTWTGGLAVDDKSLIRPSSRTSGDRGACPKTGRQRSALPSTGTS